MNKIIRFFKRIKRSFIHYWLGEVSVTKHYIYDKNFIKKVDGISIIASRYNNGAWFSDIDTSNIQDIIDSITTNKAHTYQLYIDYGSGMHQKYNFNKYQQNLLVKQLEKLLFEEEFYSEN
jgi:hypothetical protein